MIKIQGFFPNGTQTLKLKNIYSTLIVHCIYIHITFKIKNI